MDTRQFFETIYGNSEGRAVIVLPNYANKPVNDHWFAYPAQLDDMVKLVESKRNGSVWFSPVLFNSDSRVKENAKALNVAASDADTCEPENFRVQPDFVVETSINRWHVYWLLKEGADPQEVAKLNRRIAQVHKDQGADIAYVNSAKLMRVPGTANHKHPGNVVIVADYGDLDRRDFNEFSTNYPVEEVPDAVEAKDTPVPEGLTEYIAANRARLLQGIPYGFKTQTNVNIRDLLMSKYTEQKRSEMLYLLCCELYRMKMYSDEEIAALVWGAPTNKFNGEDDRGLAGLWVTAIMRAKQDVENDTVESEGEFYDETSKGKPRRTTTDFLTADERDEIRLSVNFIDQWVTWAGTRTDAPAEYHRAAAMALLSTVYSEFGQAFPKFGPLKLNIWFMVLGRSTKDRKSTSRRYMNNALRALKTDDFSYQLGDDVTPSGISLALHDRANKASVFDRDEVQGLFKELLHQSYMSGGVEVFTKLYDGWSGGRIRASGDKKVLESVEVSFIMFMMGILSESTDVLTITNYKSGFLTRFVYILGSRPDGYVAEPLQQGSEEDQEVDEVFDSLVNHLAVNRSWWDIQKPEGKLYTLRADDDAWARFQQFELDANDRAEQSDVGEIISSTTERMIITALKLATLLAMDDRSLTVKRVHMLQAIGYAGEWFDNAVTVASMVSESEWQKDVDKLEAFIVSKGGRVSYAACYNQFKSLKPKEFSDVVEALKSRGVLTDSRAGNKIILELDYQEEE